MEIQRIKQIAITDYLQQQGYAPARVQGIHYWYYSPLRNESTPSFKVNTERNQWYDFGSGEHGDIIDLVCALHRCTISEAIRLLSAVVLPVPRKPEIRWTLVFFTSDIFYKFLLKQHVLLLMRNRLRPRLHAMPPILGSRSAHLPYRIRYKLK